MDTRIQRTNTKKEENFGEVNNLQVIISLGIADDFGCRRTENSDRGS